jgi:YD repeat-containing protein
MDRPTVITYPDGTYEQFNYNKLDLEWHRDRRGNWTHNVHDALRHLFSTTDPLQRTTAYQWCTCGALQSMSDGKGNITQFDRDIQSRVTAKKYTDGSKTQYVYENSTSRLKSMIDGKGQETDYLYNLDDTMEQVNYAKGTPQVTFGYDSNYNRLTSMTDGTGQTNYYYNGYTNFSSWPPTSGTTGAGRLRGESSPLTGGSSGSPGITYSYDQLGRSLGYSIADPSSVTNAYSMTYDN